MPSRRPTSQCARSCTETERMPADATRATPATVGFDTAMDTAMAPAPAPTPAASTEFPSQTGSRTRTRRSKAFRSIRPACSAQRAESAGCPFTRRRRRQNPSAERSVSPASTACSIRANASWKSSGVALVPFVPRPPFTCPLQWDRVPAGPPTEPMSQTTVRARYQVIARIAAGGMGEVYRARDSVLGRDVAIKVLHRNLAGDPGFIDRFRREARSAALLSHPNIVAVHDWGSTTSGTYFMVMEFVRGRNVRDLLTHHGKL